MTRRVTIGVDPGGRTTALIVLGAGPEPSHRLIVRDDDAQIPGPHYLGTVVGAIRDALTAVEAILPRADEVILAVEGVVPPGGFAHGKRAPINPAGIIASGIVYGAIIGRAWAPATLVIVPPGGNGSAPLAAYPPSLVGAQERGSHGTGKLRHARSAYDVARLAPRYLTVTP